MLVLGMGEEKTPKPFISACNQFKIWIFSTATSRRKRRRKIWLLQQKLKNPETAVNRAAPAPGRTKISSGYARPLMPSSRNFLTKRDGFPPDSWAISLGKRLPDFDVRNYGYSKLTPFIKSLGNYETGRIPTGSGGRKQIYFRMKEDKQ